VAESSGSPCRNAGRLRRDSVSEFGHVSEVFLPQIGQRSRAPASQGCAGVALGAYLDSEPKQRVLENLQTAALGVNLISIDTTSEFRFQIGNRLHGGQQVKVIVYVPPVHVERTEKLLPKTTLERVIAQAVRRKPQELVPGLGQRNFDSRSRLATLSRESSFAFGIFLRPSVEVPSRRTQGRCRRLEPLRVHATPYAK